MQGPQGFTGEKGETGTPYWSHDSNTLFPNLESYTVAIGKSSSFSTNYALDVEGSINVSGTSTLKSYVGINQDPNNIHNLALTGSANVSGNLTADFITLNSPDSSTWTNNSVVPKSYVDSISSGIVLKPACQCATTIENFSPYNQTNQFTGVSTTLQIDNYTVLNGDRVLVKDQTKLIENGIYIYDNISGTLTRSDDLAYGSSAKGVGTFIQNGNINKKNNFLQTLISDTSNTAITGTDNLDFTAQNSVDFNLDPDTLELYNGNTLRVKPDLKLTSLDVSGNLSVTGNTSLANKLTITTGGLSVTGNTSLANKLTITNGGLDVTGDLKFTEKLYINNSKIIYAKNTSGTDEPFLYPRWSNNATYLNFGSGGFNIRNSIINTVTNDYDYVIYIETANITIGKSITTNLTVNGKCKATNFDATSDYRIKENVLNLIDDSKFTVDNLRPITYTNKLSGKQDIGLIAHELQEHYPFLVSGEKDGAENQSVNYIGLIGILIKEIQELKERIKKSTF